MSSFKESYRDVNERYGRVGCGAGTIIGLGLPIAMAVMGGLHLKDCPVEPYIPIYLLVAGVTGIFMTLLRIVASCCSDSDGNKPLPLEVVSGIMGLFALAWFIAGNVWVYRLHGRYSTDPDNPDGRYCDETLYLFAFWVITASYILLGVAIVLGCCCCLCALCCGRK